MKISSEQEACIEDIFTEIYEQKKWGGGENKFYSGRGSENYNTEEYRKYLQHFIMEKNISSVIDIGCGDFRVAKQIDWKDIKYTGIDIVGELIDRNNERYSTQNINFIKKDIVYENFPSADLCLIRQVFQHLSNEHILKVLPKLKKFKYVLITDGLPISTPGLKNIDKPTDYNNRWNDLYNSGLYLESPPFNISAKVVLDYLDRRKIEKFRTLLIDKSLKIL